jgi:radical SAM protein with 4Fe4S-binding SPASM domain
MYACATRTTHGTREFLASELVTDEPFDESMPELLKKSGVYTHLLSNHKHYWEDGGATYHTRYNSWDCVRGQEGDPWKAVLPVRKPGATAFAAACGINGQCHPQYVVEADGSVFPCDFYVLDEYKIGNLTENTLRQAYDNASSGTFSSRAALPGACRHCRYGSACNGGCKGL